MGFGGAKQQVPSPWGEKQFKPAVKGVRSARAAQILPHSVLIRFWLQKELGNFCVKCFCKCQHKS